MYHFFLNFSVSHFYSIRAFKNERRDAGPEILELRSALVDHKQGSMRGIPVKLHYDDNRRVNLERRDYFYAPLNGTPFSIAVVIPNYGTTWIKVQWKAHTHTHIQISQQCVVLM